MLTVLVLVGLFAGHLPRLGPGIRSDLAFGHFRYVQFLTPVEGRRRFAGQYELGRDASWPVSEESAIGIWEEGSLEPVVRLRLGASLRRGFSWEQPRRWRILELRDTTVLAVTVPIRRATVWGDDRGYRVWPPSELRIYDVSTGEVLYRRVGVSQVEDARAVGRAATLLLREGQQILWMDLDAQANLRSTARVDLQLDSISCAALPYGSEPGTPTRAMALGWYKGGLFAVPFDRETFDPVEMLGVRFGAGPSADMPDSMSSLRCAYWENGPSGYLCVGWPGFGSGDGIVQLFQTGSGRHKLWDDLAYQDESPEGLGGSCRGQHLSFLADGNQDGSPDILVSAPRSDHGVVRILSGRTGATLQAWDGGWFGALGTSLSVLPGDDDRVLVGGAQTWGVPENLAGPGCFNVLSLPSLQLAWSRSGWKR